MRLNRRSLLVRRTIQPALLLSLCGFLLSACGGGGGAGASAESATARYFEKIRGNSSLERTFLFAMPKGGDVHNHLSGAVLAESYIGWAAELNYCVCVNQTCGANTQYTIVAPSQTSPTCDSAAGLSPVCGELPIFKQNQRFATDRSTHRSRSRWPPLRAAGSAATAGAGGRSASRDDPAPVAPPAPEPPVAGMRHSSAARCADPRPAGAPLPPAPALARAARWPAGGGAPTVCHFLPAASPSFSARCQSDIIYTGIKI